MKYKDFEGEIKALIHREIRELESKEGVRVILAVESGSRSWGFASPDSDYDVRFIYVRDRDFYLSLKPKKDFIDWKLDETLDITGWDVTKVLQHIHKSNGSVFEWLGAPIVYYAGDEADRLREISREYFSSKTVMYHYYGTARSNYTEYLTGDRVRYKKYFYVLRPLLACRWIEAKGTPPPVFFEDLVKELNDEGLKAEINRLVEIKKRMTEGETGEHIPIIDEFIVNNLGYYKSLLEKMPEDRNRDWKPIDRCFREILDK